MSIPQIKVSKIPPSLAFQETKSPLGSSQIHLYLEEISPQSSPLGSQEWRTQAYLDAVQGAIPGKANAHEAVAWTASIAQGDLYEKYCSCFCIVFLLDSALSLWEDWLGK